METTYYNSIGTSKQKYLEAITENEFGNVIRKRRVYFPLKEIRFKDKTYFLQYNDKMELLYDACHYLNFEIAGSSDKTRRFKASVLRRYICFMELLGYEYNKLEDQYVIDRVVSFFRGDDYRSTDNPTYRKHISVSNYISVIRDFARTCNKNINIKVDNKNYPSSLKDNPHSKDNVRHFIYPEEFKALMLLATDKKDYQAMFLFHLMYFYGLRIGECLGLTEEDFIMRRKNYAPSPTLLLRNRLSDRPFQYSKELFHPSSRMDYNVKSYPSDKVVLSMQFYEKFTAYVEHTRNKFISKGKYDRAVADSISGTFEREHGKNHYIFLNEYGKPLSQQAWNLRLKDYFLAAGIPLDVAVKHDNLNHRFRHGCAMYYLRFAEKKMTIEEVHSLMRHRSFNSTYIYLKVTIDDELILRQQFQDSLLKELPLLVE